MERNCSCKTSSLKTCVARETCRAASPLFCLHRCVEWLLQLYQRQWKTLHRDGNFAAKASCSKFIHFLRVLDLSRDAYS